MDNKHFKYGLFFHVFYSEITSESLSLLEKAKNGGFDGVEISVTPELLSSNKDILKELKIEARIQYLVYFLHRV